MLSKDFRKTFTRIKPNVLSTIGFPNPQQQGFQPKLNFFSKVLFKNPTT